MTQGMLAATFRWILNGCDIIAEKFKNVGASPVAPGGSGFLSFPENSKRTSGSSGGASLAGGMTEGLSLAVYRFPDDLAALREAWARVTESLPHKRFFHLFPWYLGYLDSLESDPTAVFFCVAHRGATPVAIFPLKCVRRRMCGLHFNYLEIPVNDHLNLSDFIFDKTPDNAVLLRALIRQVRRLSGRAWDVICIPSALEDSAANYALRQAPMRMSLSEPVRKSNHVDCRMAYEELAGNFKNNFRRNLRRLHRRAQETGTLQFKSYESREEILSHFHKLLEVEASGWKGETGTAISCDQVTTRFYRKVAEEFSITGQCRLNILTLNEKCIAAQLCLLVDGMLYILKIGFDEAHAAIAPGNLIMEELFRQCAADDRIHGVSFITGREWNFLWGATSAQVYEHHLFNPASLMGWIGYLACRGKRFLRPLIQRIRRSRKTVPAADKTAITNP